MRDSIHQHAIRALAVATIAAAGLLAIVGTGGGDPGPFTVKPGACDSCGVPSSPPYVTVSPGSVMVQAGTPATFSATVSNASGVVAYRWSRSLDNGYSFTEIPGATQRSYTIASATLADDAMYQVTVSIPSASYIGRSVGLLYVSSSPGIVFQDGDFEQSDWTALPFANLPPTLAFTVERVPEGGHPGSFMKIVFEQPQGYAYLSVSFAKRSAVYDPGAQGPLYMVDYAEDCLELLSGGSPPPSVTGLLLEQAGRAYLSSRRSCHPNEWSAPFEWRSLRAEDFEPIAGPPCGAGESCPDFSLSGLPMRFGFRRITSARAQGATIVHSIDNWSVTLWKR